MTKWHKLKRHLTAALDHPPLHTDKATIAQVLFLMATMEEDYLDPEIGKWYDDRVLDLLQNQSEEETQ